jgi:hypothetical protein
VPYPLEMRIAHLSLRSAAVAVIAILGIGCGGTSTDSPDIPTHPINRSSRLLTNEPPSIVKQDCEWLAARAEEAVICPRLVPRGPTISQEPYVDGSYYSANFVSESLDGESHPGHWSFEAGTRREIRAVLRTNRPGGALRPIASFSQGATPIRLFKIAGYQNIHQDHIVARWFCDGRAFAVSVHGLENFGVVKVMAKDLLRLIDQVEPCGQETEHEPPTAD